MLSTRIDPEEVQYAEDEFPARTNQKQKLEPLIKKTGRGCPSVFQRFVASLLLVFLWA